MTKQRRPKPPCGGFTLQGEDILEAKEINGKKQITFEKLETVGTRIGESVELHLPRGIKAIGKVINMTEVPNTLEPNVANPQIRFIVEIQAD